MLITNKIAIKPVGIVFQINNQYQRLAYHALIKEKHINDYVVIIDSQTLRETNNLFERVYIITDYIHYASQCVCADVNSNKLYVVDESGNSSSSLRKQHINKNAHSWVKGKTSFQKPECLYCRTFKNLSLSEIDFISTLTFNINEASDLKEKIMSYLDIDRKGYSRLLRKLLTRLELKNEHALFRWANNQTYQKIKEM